MTDKNDIDPRFKRVTKIWAELKPFKDFLSERETEAWTKLFSSFDRFLGDVRNPKRSPHANRQDAGRLGESVSEAVKKISARLDFIEEHQNDPPKKRSELGSLLALAALLEKRLGQVPTEYQSSLAKPAKEFHALVEKMRKRMEGEDKRLEQHERYVQQMSESAAGFSKYLFELSDRFILGGAAKISVSYKYRRERDNELMVALGEDVTKEKGGPLFAHGSPVSLESVSFYAKGDATFGRIEYAYIKGFSEIVGKVFKEQQGDRLSLGLKLRGAMGAEKSRELYRSLIQSKDGLEISTLGDTSIFVYAGRESLLHVKLDALHKVRDVGFTFDIGSKLEPVKGYFDAAMSFFKGERAISPGSVHDHAVSLSFYAYGKL